MTNRFARQYQKLRDRLGGRRKLALAIIGIWIAAELLVAAAVAIVGKEWVESGTANSSSSTGSAPGFSLSRSRSSIAVF